MNKANQRAYVQQAPPGICTVTDGQVTRHVTRPCRVTVATLRATSPNTAVLDAARRFAPFCARRVIITRPLNRLMAPEELLDFGANGIGVCLEHDNGELETLVEPRPWRPIPRHMPAAAVWCFEETAYGQFLSQQTSALPSTPVT